MPAYLARRIVASLFVLLAAVSITFLLVRLMPGGIFLAEREIPEFVKKNMLEQYRLAGPLHEQYLSYIGDLLRGDLRLSKEHKGFSVKEILAQCVPVSLVLGSVAFILATLGGISLGVLAAAHRNRALDGGLMLVAVLGISIPTFVTGPLLLLIFAFWLGWFPLGGWGSVSQLILPAITLALPFTAYIARLMRTSMLDVLSQEFVRTATAKGLHPAAVLWKHAAKVAILPVVTYLGPLAANLLTGSIVIEHVFNIPGAGQFFVTSMLNRDPFLLSGVVLVYCGLLVSLNLVVDLVYRGLDPRIAPAT